MSSWKKKAKSSSTVKSRKKKENRIESRAIKIVKRRKNMRTVDTNERNTNPRRETRAGRNLSDETQEMAIWNLSQTISTNSQ